MIKKLGEALEENCPDNDCRIFLNLYRLHKEYATDLKLNVLGINTQHVILREMHRLENDMCDLYLFNYAVRAYRKEFLL